MTSDRVEGRRGRITVRRYESPAEADRQARHRSTQGSRGHRGDGV